MSDDPYNASDRADVKANATAARLAQRSDDEVVRSLMRTVQGRQWLYGILSRCHLYQTTFTGEPLNSAFREGERNIGLYLQAEIIRTSPDELISMMREAHGRDITNEFTRRNRRDAAANDDAIDTSTLVDYAATVASEPIGASEE